MPDNTFDVVSVVDMTEVLNAVQQARKEVQTRFDLKDSKSQIDLNEKDKKLVIQSVDDFKLKAVVDVLQQKLAKRKAEEAAEQAAEQAAKEEEGEKRE